MARRELCTFLAIRPGDHQATALKKIWLLAYGEAQVQSFADAYLSIAVCFALSVMMVPLMRKSGSKGASRVAQANDPEEAENAAKRLYARM
jgi:hypothetical protein